MNGAEVIGPDGLPARRYEPIEGVVQVLSHLLAAAKLGKVRAIGVAYSAIDPDGKLTHDSQLSGEIVHNGAFLGAITILQSVACQAVSGALGQEDPGDER